MKINKRSFLITLLGLLFCFTSIAQSIDETLQCLSGLELTNYQYCIVKDSSIEKGGDLKSQVPVSLMYETLVAEKVWAAVSEGKFRLHNKLDWESLGLDSSFSKIRYGQLLNHTSGVRVIGKDTVLMNDSIGKFKHELSNIHLLAKALWLKTGNKIDKNFSRGMSLCETLDLQSKVLSGANLSQAFKHKMIEPRLVLGKMGFGNGWYMQKIRVNNDTHQVAFSIKNYPNETFLFFHIPGLGYHTALCLKGLPTSLNPDEYIQALIKTDNRQLLSTRCNIDHDFVLILVLLTVLALVMLLLNSKKSKKRKAFKTGNNTIAILVLLTCITITVLMLLGFF